MAPDGNPLLSLLPLFYQMLKDFWGWLKENRGKKPAVFPFRKPQTASRQLVDLLQRKYPKTRFEVVKSQHAFYQTIARELVSSIESRLEPLPAGERVDVGIICGPMVFNTIEWLRKHFRANRRVNYTRLHFVAMNKAAESESFRYSGNYQVAALSEIFPDSNALAYTDSIYNREKFDERRAGVDILLCSVGASAVGEQKNYINRWLGNIPADKIGAAGLDKGYIGDFCLTPIAMDGRAAYDPAMGELIKAHLDPFPRFNYVRDIKPDKIPYVIFPIYTNEPDGGVKSFPITGKELISQAVLRSGVVDVCVLNPVLARNLERSIGRLIFKKIAPAVDEVSHLRRCKVHDLKRNEEREISIYDPYGRIEALGCEKDETLQPQAITASLPSMIISELKGEDKDYDWGKGEGLFKYNINSVEFAFYVDRFVRRPGQWALISFLQALRLINNSLYKETEPLKVWDLGSGCGVIGLLIGRHDDHNKIGKLLFTDIDPKALECTEINIKRHGLQAKAEIRLGSLFTVAQPDEKFHLIVFNPPFLPLSGITSLGQNLDIGGDKGEDLAKLYCEQVIDHLALGGRAILVVPDYIDDGHLGDILKERFGEANVDVKERLILYPANLKPPVPTSYEIQYQETIEKNCGYNFETIYLGEERYIAFRMRHYLAHRTA